MYLLTSALIYVAFSPTSLAAFINPAAIFDGRGITSTGTESAPLLNISDIVFALSVILSLATVLPVNDVIPLADSVTAPPTYPIIPIVGCSCEATTTCELAIAL